MSRVTAPQAAKILSTSRVTVFRWVEDGLLNADRITRRNIIMIDVDELKRFARNNGYTFDEKIAKQLAE